MNTFIIQSAAFNDAQVLQEQVRQTAASLKNLGYEDARVDGVPGELHIQTASPIELGMLNYVSDMMTGRTYTTTLNTEGKGQVGIELD